jgi:hypothetical protein
MRASSGRLLGEAVIAPALAVAVLGELPVHVEARRSEGAVVSLEIETEAEGHLHAGCSNSATSMVPLYPRLRMGPMRPRSLVGEDDDVALRAGVGDEGAAARRRPSLR